jgi:chaperonin GroES
MLELKAKLDLSKVVLLPNIADKLKEPDLRKIAAEVVNKYHRDRDSRKKWEHETRMVIELARLDHNTKNTPYENCANIKYPLTSVAVLQFAARAYPELVRNGKVIGIATIGKDPEGNKEARASRAEDFMNWQLLTESSEFEESLDKLLHTLPLVGVAFKKTYYDPIKKRNASELCPYDEIFINNNVKSLEDARAVTHKLEKHRNYILEKIRYGHYSEIDEEKLDNVGNLGEGEELHAILEQHCFLDLDGDGYEEPYIVTVLEKTQDILRIVARFDPDQVELNAKGEIQCIHPIQYFTDFMYIPNPDGSYYGIGIGHLLFGANDAINTLFNQLVDAGRFGNMPTGIIGRGLRIKGGELKLKPGLLLKLDTALNGPIKDEIHMFDFKDPSPVLFQLLNLLIEGAQQLASISDTNTGSAQVQNVAQNVMASQIDQGTKVFSGIQRRLFRGLKKEFEKLYRLNRIFLDPQKYFKVLDDELAISNSDFDEESFDITPVADPSMSSDAQRLARDQRIMELGSDPVWGGLINKHEALTHLLTDLRFSNIDRMIIPPDPNAPPPPEIIQLQSEIQAKSAQEKLDLQHLDLKKQDLLIKAHLAEAEINKMNSEADLARANAGYANAKPQLETHKADMGVIMGAHSVAADVQKEHIKAEAKAKPNPGV